MAGVNIDWAGLGAKPTDFVGDFVNAFRAGQSLAQNRPGGAPATAAAANAFAPQDAARGPDFSRAVASMTPDQRRTAAKRADALGAVLTGLGGASANPADRLAMARHVAERTPGLGIDPAAIRPQDVTDAGLAGHLASVGAMKTLLETPPEGGGDDGA